MEDVYLQNLIVKDIASITHTSKKKRNRRELLSDYKGYMWIV